MRVKRYFAPHLIHELLRCYATPAILHPFGIRWFSKENHYFLMCVRVNKSELLSCEQERVLTFWPLYHIISSRRMRGKWFEKLDWAEERTCELCCPKRALKERKRDRKWAEERTCGLCCPKRALEERKRGGKWAEERTWGACCPATALEEVDWDIWGIKSTKTYSWLSGCARCSLR